MQKKVVVIGASIMDITGFPAQGLIPYDSVPGRVLYGNGGVGRNIAENLLRLSVPTYFISAFGGDGFGELLNASILDVGGDTSQCLFLEKQNSALHLAMMDEKNDMAAGIAAMKINKYITPDFLAPKKKFLNTCCKVVVDTNLPQETLKWISENIAKEKLAIDLVSIEMARKVVDIIGEFGTVKANRKEASLFLGKAIKSKIEAEAFTQLLLGYGCQKVFLTMGKDGVMAASKTESVFISIPYIEARSTTGAGDAFMAGLIVGGRKDEAIESQTKYGVAAASIAIASIDAVSPEMNVENLLKKLK